MDKFKWRHCCRVDDIKGLDNNSAKKTRSRRHKTQNQKQKQKLKKTHLALNSAATHLAGDRKFVAPKRDDIAALIMRSQGRFALPSWLLACCDVNADDSSLGCVDPSASCRLARSFRPANNLQQRRLSCYNKDSARYLLRPSAPLDGWSGNDDATSIIGGQSQYEP